MKKTKTKTINNIEHLVANFFDILKKEGLKDVAIVYTNDGRIVISTSESLRREYSNEIIIQ